MAVPCHAFHSDHGNVATEAAEAFNQCYICAGASRANCRSQPAGSSSDYDHIGFMNYVNFANWLDNLMRRFRHVLNRFREIIDWSFLGANGKRGLLISLTLRS